MKINYHDKKFRSIRNTENGEVDPQTIFHYRQVGDLITGTYQGGMVVQGQLLAKVNQAGQLDMRYHHLNMDGQFMLGKCLSTPEILPDGRIKLHEEWQWLSGDGSKGTSEIEEIPSGQL